MRAALYARYSSDNQREASIADQLRLCRLHAERQGWKIVEEYSDHAISGPSLLRPGIQALMADAGRCRFDVILTESLDRLSRDQEDVAGFYKRMRFANVRIVTLSEGEISELHIGLKGTMGALYLKDLADKTRRGLRGRVEAGKSGGGLCYGYTVDRRLGADGQPINGERTIDRAQAEIVRRIFREYADGGSSRAIAWRLNKDGIPGPFGNAWGPARSTATQSAAMVSSITSYSAGWFGTGSASSRTRRAISAFRASTPSPSGSSRRSPSCGSSMTNSGGGLRNGSARSPSRRRTRVSVLPTLR